MKIISGGQSGADISGNLFAYEHGIETEVNAFEGFKPVRGTIPPYIKVNYVCDKKDYVANLKCRTIYNIDHSDLTIILLKDDIYYTKGSLFTLNRCMKSKKNVITTDIYTQEFDYTLFGIQYFTYRNKPTSLKEMVQKLEPKILNIAGQRELDERDAVIYLEKILS